MRGPPFRPVAYLVNPDGTFFRDPDGRMKRVLSGSDNGYPVSNSSPSYAEYAQGMRVSAHYLLMHPDCPSAYRVEL